jgi:5-methylcytosine-specific restriction endonuclease McrA
MMNTCEYCSKEITRKRSGSKDQLRFCNVACANSGRVRKKKPKPVRELKTRLYVWENVTLAELRKEIPDAKRYHAKLRGYSRRAYKGPDICAVCSYSRHVEIAHIIAAKSFDPNTKLSVVNAETNLAALCRNCHWEFDNGLLFYDVDSAVWKML